MRTIKDRIDELNQELDNTTDVDVREVIEYKIEAISKICDKPIDVGDKVQTNAAWVKISRADKLLGILQREPVVGHVMSIVNMKGAPWPVFVVRDSCGVDYTLSSSHFEHFKSVEGRV
jgi:hypothetical protein